jgi:hypothetical protein
MKFAIVRVGSDIAGSAYDETDILRSASAAFVDAFQLEKRQHRR